MTSLNNTSESGAVGATVTTGNSGGASGDAWDTVMIGANASVTYVESPVMVGKRGYRVATGATAVTAYLQWTAKITQRWPSGLGANYGGVYFIVTAIPGVDTTFIEFTDTAGTTNRANLRVRSTGVLRLRNAANGTVASGTVVLALNTLYRVEYQIDGAVAGLYQVVLYLGNSLTPLETLSGSGNFGGVIGTIRWGYVSNVTNAAAIYFDAINVNDVGLPGPADYRSIFPGRPTGPRAGSGNLPAFRLADDFADNVVDTAMWTQFAFGNGSGSETGGQYQITITSGGTGVAQLLSQSRYDLSGDYFAVEVTSPGVQESGLQAYACMAQIDASNQVFITIANGNVGAIQNVGGSLTGLAFITYDANLHRWFRVREAAGTTFWEVSANGVFWILIHSAANPIALTDVTLLIAADTFSSLGTTKIVTFGQVAAPALT